MPDLTLADLSASYGGKRVLDRVSLRVGSGDAVAIIGPSGSGRSTLLRVLIGLLPPDGGQVAVDGAAIDYGSRAAVRALRDRLAIVFQHYNLFQNMTEIENVMVAPVRVKGRRRAGVREEAASLLDRVGLGSRMHAYPDQLSGGQQQRIAIARARAASRNPVAR